MSAAASYFTILVLVTVSSTLASPIPDCPESAAARGHDQPIIFDSTPPLIQNNDNIIPKAPLLLPPAHTAAAPIIPYPDNDSIVPETPLIPSPNNDTTILEAPLLSPPTAVAAAAPIIPYPDNDSIVPETPLIPSPNNDTTILEAPLLSPPTAVAAAAPAEQTVTDGVEPLMQPSASTNLNENENEIEGGEQLGADNPNENKNTDSTGFAGATRAIGGGAGAKPLVDNTPFDSASTTTYGFMSFSSCIALTFLSVLI